MNNNNNLDLDNSLINQTQFSFEEPMRETGAKTFAQPKVEAVKSTNKNFPLIKLFAGLGLVLIVLGVAAFLMSSNQVQQIAEPTETDKETQKPIFRDPIDTRLENAKKELEDADPARQDLVFPPVNMNIRLDEKPR